MTAVIASAEDFFREAEGKKHLDLKLLAEYNDEDTPPFMTLCEIGDGIDMDVAYAALSSAQAAQAAKQVVMQMLCMVKVQ